MNAPIDMASFAAQVCGMKPAKRPKSTTTFLYTIEDIELRCEMDYEPGGGDGWDEPRYEADATVCEAWVGTTDILALLNEEQRTAIEIAFLEEEPEYDGDEPDFADDETSFG